MSSSSLNSVSLGNGLFARVQLCNPTLESYHVAVPVKDLKLQIEGNTVTWFIPANLFNHRDHIKFEIKLFSHAECLLCLKKNCLYHKADDDEVQLIIGRGNDRLQSWGNRGGDFCVVNPKSNIASVLSELMLNDTSSMLITTYGVSKQRCTTECDGPAHFATYGKSSQKFRPGYFNEDKATAVTTVFNFIVVNE